MVRQRSAFTLIELLVTVAIIATLVAILMPALGRARSESQRLLCLTNLRQMGIAAECYAQKYDDRYPIACYKESRRPFEILYAWDVTAIADHTTRPPEVRYVPGILWEGKTIEKIQQCPSFDGEDNWAGEPYTGYNYNTSYIGHGNYQDVAGPAKTTDVRRPAECALFGDGEYGSGANKFMRSPLPSPTDEHLGEGRFAGTQGFRHLDQTNVVWCDGHGSSMREPNQPDELAEGSYYQIAKGTGFLLPLPPPGGTLDRSLYNTYYDLE
ncbi:MAG: type II secretion system protein [Phycisphaerae bacterium]|nr:type II secretion system protein [Phycisphaerae bacterium]